MDFNRLDQHLRDSLVDLRLSNEERDELRELGNDLTPDQVRYMRNRAFDLVRELITDPDNAVSALKWLEQVIKTLEVRCVARVVRISAQAKAAASASATCAARPRSRWMYAYSPSPTTSSATS